MKNNIIIVGLISSLIITSQAISYTPDNTGVNMRDRNTDSLTPMNQSEASSDLAITQNIRKSVVADRSLSMNAKNIKIITQNGVVTLRGPVLNNQEKEVILKIAQGTNGVNNVNNQLEVTTHN